MKVQPVGKPQEVFRGKIYRILEQKVRHPDGGEAVYEFVEKPSGVLVIPIDDDDLITFVRENRALKDGDEQWALPGGIVEAKETPEKPAERELMEETGIKGKIEFFAKRPSAPRTIWDLRIFTATKLKQIKDPRLETKKVPITEAIHMALEDELETDFAALSLIQWAIRNYRIEFLEKEIDPRLLGR